MPRQPKPKPRFPVRLTQAQRRVIAEIIPVLADQLMLDERNLRAIPLTLAELQAIHAKVGAAVRHAVTGRKENSLRHVLDATTYVIEHHRGGGSNPGSKRVYQFRISLRDSRPPIWRRIQVKTCTLDKLHEHIQTAMGWTNSHLHHFKVGDQLYGDPLLMQENFEDMGYKDSTTTKISQIVPRDGRRFRFRYKYDFGDCWDHEVLFEGFLRAEPRRKYPLCLEGERACPPEDVGGTWGYREFLEAITDPEHEDHDGLLEWAGGSFDPEAFDAAAATKEMRRGIFDWRSERWV
jgi:hypothetical protein